MEEASAAAEALPTPPTKLVLRTREGLFGFIGPPSHVRYEGEPAVPCPPIEVHEDAVLNIPGAAVFSMSRDGSAIVCIKDTAVEVKSTDDGSIRCIIEQTHIQAADLSPLGNYLVTWQRPLSDAETDEGNLKVWCMSTGTVVCSYRQKLFRKVLWPSVQWSLDETISMRMVTNELHLFNGHTMADGHIGKITLAGCTAFSLAPLPTYTRVAVFVPELKGKPARANIYTYPEVASPTASKSFYQADTVDLKWSPDGEVVLIHTHTDMDKSGNSYYGSTSLYLLRADGEFDCIVPLSKEGLIHDVAWNPNSRDFIVVAGSMPAQSTLYNLRCEPIFEFGQAHRNTISWSPHGRFVCLAGFGNLAGEMDFWDRNKLKKMGSNTAHTAVEFGWSPDGRYFMTATCAPRMNMDNGIKIFKYSGIGPLIERRIERLYEAKWRDALPDVYPDRPQSPKRKGEAKAETLAPAEVKVAAYRPPGATGTLAAQIRAERESKGGARKVKPGSKSSGGSTIPGLPPQPYIPGLASVETKSGGKKKKPKDKKKQDDEGVAKPVLPPPQSAPAKIIEEKQSKPVESSELDVGKRVKNLKKKLKQIEELKTRRDNGEQLNDDQREKLNTEEAIRAELAQLEM